MDVGVLALQGDFAAHASALGRLGARVRAVRRTRELEGLAGLVLPGGESTALLRLMAGEPWFPALAELHARGAVFFGTCAGAILLARSVRPEQPSLGLLDATVDRNAYGRQLDSFEARVEVPALAGSVAAAFIRAPRFASLGPRVEVLGRLGGEPVLVREGRLLAATFHSELYPGEGGVHRLFLELASRPAVAPSASGAEVAVGAAAPARG